MKYKVNTGAGCCRPTAKGCGECLKNKLNTFDYLSDLPKGCNVEDYVEVQFKNTRKGYYLNSLKLPLSKGDMVAVESSPGHDIGMVSLTGKLVEMQMRKVRYRHPSGEPRRIYRLAKPSDLERFEEAKALEYDTMIRSRQIAKELSLDMKIGDVEYQGDGQKAIFYYIADGRVDFRQLIRKLAEAFRVRIEMKQIGARQEAGRIGGLGPCGRQLCCSGWMTNFVSVGTNAARLQDLSMNPQKLAGQCAKLKCCLNYEVDTYFEAQKRMPSREVTLSTQEGGTYRFFKSDPLANTTYYISTNPKDDTGPIPLSSERVFQILEMNKRGEKPFSLLANEEGQKAPSPSVDILGENSLTRFDSKPSSRRRPHPRKARKEAESTTASSPTTEHSAKEGRREKRRGASGGRRPSSPSGNSRGHGNPSRQRT